MADRARCPRIYAHEARLFLRFAGDPALADRVGFDRDELEALDGSVPIVSLYDLVEAAVDDDVRGGVLETLEAQRLACIECDLYRIDVFLGSDRQPRRQKSRRRNAKHRTIG